MATLVGFALIAAQTSTPDTVDPLVALSANGGSTVGSVTPFFWSALGVAQFTITGTNGYASGIRSALASAGIIYAPAFTSSGTYTFTIAGLDALGSPVLVGGVPVSSTLTLTVAA